MEITLLKNNSCKIQPKPHSTDKPELRNKTYSSVPKCCPAYFSPSFTALQKTDFEGTDRLVFVKYNLLAQNFRTKKDFDMWVENRCDDILKKDYAGKLEETTEERKNLIAQWQNYIYNEDDVFTSAERLLILDGITKDLDKKNDNIPPELNPGVLADTLADLKTELENNPRKEDFNFYNEYEKHLTSHYLENDDDSTGTGRTEWIVIPSKEHDPEHFEENVKRLKALSCKSWCTKSNSARPYLEKGDFHVYIEKGKKTLGIRFIGDKIEEIQGPQNNSKIPFRYYDLCKSYVDENRFELLPKADRELKHGKILKEKYTPLIKEFKKLKNEKDIFEKLGIAAEQDEKGRLTISHFYLPEEMRNDGISYDDLGINLDKLLKNVKEIKGNANFNGIKVSDLSTLEKIGGNADFMGSEIGNLGGLEAIDGNVYINFAKINNLSKLTKIGGNASLCALDINLESLTSIGGDAEFSGITIKDISNLKTIGGNAKFFTAKITDMSGLESIGGDVDFTFSTIEDLSGLKSIGGDVQCAYSHVGNLDSLKYVGGEMSKSWTSVELHKGKVERKVKIFNSVEDFIEDITKKPHRFSQKLLKTSSKSDEKTPERQEQPKEENSSQKPQKSQNTIISAIKGLFEKFKK